MTARQVALFALFAFALSVGQILFKQASGSLEGGQGPGGVFSLASSWYFWTAVSLYGGSTLLWIWLIKDTALNRAYPFVALAFVMVPALSYFILGERLTRAGLVGAALIVVGIVVSQT